MEFTSPDMLDWLAAANEEAIDALDFGVVQLDDQGIAQRYNDFESRQSGLSKAEVLKQNFFEEIAPCMNNLMVAGRFSESRQSSTPLDAVIDYVLAFRARVTPVKLRLIYSPRVSGHYLLIQRL